MRWFILGSLFLFLWGCKEEPKSPVIASVNEVTLTEEELRNSFVESEWKTLTNEDKKKFINQWIDITALSEQAEKEGLTKSKVVQERIKSALRKYKANLYISSQIANIKISEVDMFNYYQVHKAEYQKKANEYKVQQIVLTKDTYVDSVWKYVNAGRFTDAAKKFSRGKMAYNGGYIGFTGQNDFAEELWNKLDKQTQYEVGKVEYNGKIYFLRWYRSREISVVKTFDETKEVIRQVLRQSKLENSYQKSLDKAKNKQNIKLLFRG